MEIRLPDAKKKRQQRMILGNIMTKTEISVASREGLIVTNSEQQNELMS